MHTAHIVLVSLLAFVFVVAGLGRASGNAKVLSTTRNVNVSDGWARFIGACQALGALALIIGLRVVFIQWIGLVILWVSMGVALYFHFRANKVRDAVPIFLLLTLVTIALVTI
jgi:DoxX-like family